MLNREEILKLTKEKNLVGNFIDIDTQATPNGIDLTAAAIFEFDSPGQLDFSNKERRLPQGKEILPEKEKPQDQFGWWQLKPGTYKVRTNEVISLPNDLIALAFSRTSLLRMGAFTQHGVWDAGFSGKGEFVLVVGNAHGLRLKQNARIAQVVFFRINQTKQGYDGIYNDKK